MIYWLIAAILILLFGLVVFRGAPYVPTLKGTLATALDLFNLQSNDLLVDLGSGDGGMLKAAAKRGIRATGYEINPLLCAVAWARCFAYHSLVTVKLRDYWLTDLPPDTKGVFVFLAGPYMQPLAEKLQKEMAERERPLKVVSYGFEIPGFAPKKVHNGLYLYELQPNAKMDMALQTAQ